MHWYVVSVLSNFSCTEKQCLRTLCQIVSMLYLATAQGHSFVVYAYLMGLGALLNVEFHS